MATGSLLEAGWSLSTAAITCVALIEPKKHGEEVSTNRRLEAFRMNDGGWTEQMKNIEKHVAQTS